MKEILQHNGISDAETSSLSQILKTAYQFGMIKDEKTWLDALVLHNNIAHAYNNAVALEIIIKTKELYYDMFVKLKEEITL